MSAFTWPPGRVAWRDSPNGAAYRRHEGLFVDGVNIHRVACFVAPEVRGFRVRQEPEHPERYCRFVGGDALCSSPLPAPGVLEALTESGFTVEVTEFTTRELGADDELAEGSDLRHRVRQVRHLYEPRFTPTP